MKYKIGDKVKIKTWDAMEKEFGLDGDRDIKGTCFLKEMEEDVEDLNRVVTIERVCRNYYDTEELDLDIDDEMLEGLAEAEEKPKMKYKVGDRVKIKTWDAMEKEFGLNKDGNIDCKEYFMKDMEKEVAKFDRILIINNIYKNFYIVKECLICKTYWTFSDDMIEGLAEEEKPNISNGKSNDYNMKTFNDLFEREYEYPKNIRESIEN